MSNKKIRLSVIIPAYNVEDYIGQSLKSILDMQMSDEAEVIIINDGSTDNTLDVIKEFIIKNEKLPFEIHLIDQKNAGLSTARNNGLEMAQGEYLYFMDSDDIIHCDALRLMIKEAIVEGADIVVGNYYEFINISGEKKLRNDKSNFELPLTTIDERMNKLFTIDISFAVWNKLYKRDFLISKKLNFKKDVWFEDLDFVFRAFYEAGKVVKNNEYVYGYRQRPNSIMTRIVPKMLDKILVMEDLAIFLKDKGTFNKFKNQYETLYLKMAFSILFSLVSRKTNSFNSIATGILKNPNFVNLIKNKPSSLRLMKKKEQIFYYLLKFRIINFYTLKIVSSIRNLWE